VFCKSHKYAKSIATQLQADSYASAVCSPQARHIRAAVCDYENREFEQNKSHKLDAVSGRQVDTRSAKIKADFRNFSFRNLVRENIPIQVCEKKKYSYVHMCAIFQSEKSGIT
jgi:hypothetical protein